MEYMSAGSLYDIVKLWIKGCRIDENNTAFCIQSVLLAVQFLHSRNRIHRDIKVDNILLTAEGDVKLADFGTAVQLTFQRLRRNTVAGTPYYMAPELIQKIPYREKVDIWSIGITVIELINGRPPFYDLNPREALNAIVVKGVRGLVSPHLSDSIKHFVNICCLCINPQDRLSATQLLTHPFMQKACSKEEFAKFIFQTYRTFNSPATGCNIL